jgi:hypothetical protein
VFKPDFFWASPRKLSLKIEFCDLAGSSISMQGFWLGIAASVRESPMQIDVHHSGNISVSGAVTSTNNDDDDCMCVETLCDYGKKGLCLLVNKPDIEFKNCGGSLCKDTRLHHFCQMSYMSKMGMPEIHVFRCMKCLSEPI